MSREIWSGAEMCPDLCMYNPNVLCPEYRHDCCDDCPNLPPEQKEQTMSGVKCEECRFHEDRRCHHPDRPPIWNGWDAEFPAHIGKCPLGERKEEEKEETCGTCRWAKEFSHGISPCTTMERKMEAEWQEVTSCYGYVFENWPACLMWRSRNG